ncbi:NUP85 family protein [Megaselia abdita]
MDVDKVPELEIPDKLSTRDGICLAGNFITNSKLSFSAFRNITRQTKDVPSPYANKEDVKVFHLQPNFIFDDPILRTLIGEANGIFVTLQELQKDGNKQDYVKISRTYRSIIRACLEKLQEAVDTSEEYQNFITILYSIECIWHLSEILFIDPIPSNVVTPQLLEWTRFHFPAAERNATDLLLHGRDADESEEYWPSVKGLILQGQIDVARAILQLHSMSESNAFKMAEQILKSMPSYNIYGGLSVQKFRSQWQYWLTDTERKLSTGIFATEPDLEEIIYIIIGNTQTWNKFIKQSQNWYELFPGFLFFTDPACKSFELGTLAQCWINRWANIKDFAHSNFMKHLDKVILYLLESDIHKVLHSIQQIGDNQWFVTHLTDLLYNCGQLELIGENKLTDCEDFRLSLLFDFGSTLMARDSIWLLGINYLEQCGLEGEGAVKTLLSRIPVKNEKQALKVIEIAQGRGYIEVEHEICKIFAKRSMALGRPGNALDWAIRSKDTTYVTSITDFFLEVSFLF